MKTEKHLWLYMKRQAAKAHVGCYKLFCESRNGWPDVFLVVNGNIVLVELKSPAKTGRLSPVQKILIEILTKLGVEIYVINQPAEADEIISGLARRPPAPRHRPLI